MSDGMWTVLGIAGVLVLATGVAVAVLLVRLVRARRMLTDAGIPLSNKLTFWGAIAYVISPVDLLPDPILLDDIGVLLLALRSLYGAAEAAGLTTGKDNQTKQNNQSKQANQTNQSNQSNQSKRVKRVKRDKPGKQHRWNRSAKSLDATRRS